MKRMTMASVAALVVSAPLLAQERSEVIERIKPVGQVAIEGQAQAASAEPAAPAAPAAPASEAAAPAAAAAPAPEAAAAAPAAGSDDPGAALYVAKGCTACHGADGKTPIMPIYPKVAGLPQQYIANQMTDIKSGARSNGQSAVMKGIMAAVSDEDIQAIATWLSNQPR
ncbi:c-type cytochrome [Sedimenticola thiotaurini]|uniref:Cytochrome c domain-containing protein n=1 Tax=Sedimenticola thiotaurini TaxID=1543721 RepID=A0A0F7JW84_9GAMM|nr:hypothetical protein AAY24_10725 [Sedimenticola thiotaurini]